MNTINHDLTFMCLAQKAFSIILFFALIFFCFSLPYAYGSEKNQWINVGPSWGGDAFKVVIDPTNNNRLYLVGQTVHKSENGGESWVPIMKTHEGTWNLPVYQLVVNPSDPDILYIGTIGSGIWKSTDGGEIWSPVNETLPEDSREIRSVIIDKNDPSLIYISLLNSNGKLESSVYRSKDGGSTWNPLSQGLPVPYASVTAIFQDPHTGNLFAATYGEGIYKLSSETGSIWTPMNNGLEGLAKYITYVSFDYQNEGFMYACTHKDWLYRSYDGGNSWHPMNLPNDIVATYPPMAYYLEVDPNNSDIIWVGAAPGSNHQNQTPFYRAEVQQDVGGLFHSKDSGITWEKIFPDFGGFRMTIDPSEVIETVYGHSSKIKYLAYIGGMSVWKSENSGHSYTIKNQGVTGAWINTFFQDPDDPSILLAAGQFGIAYTLDGGATWSHTRTAPKKSAYPWSIIKDPNNSNRYYYTLGEPAWDLPENKGLYFLDIDDLLGNQTKNISISHQIASTRGIGIWEAYFLTSGSIYLATQDKGILKSKDDAHSWIALNSGLKDNKHSVTTIVFDNDDIPLFAGTRTFNGSPEWLTRPQEDGGLYAWNNNLEQWEQIASDTITKAVFDVQLSPKDSQTIFAGTAEGLFVSTNSGKNWEKKHLGFSENIPISGIVFDPKNLDRIFLATFFHGVFVSIDGGRYWTQYSQGLSYLQIQQIEFDNRENNGLFASTLGGGIYSCQTGHAPVIESLKTGSVVLEKPYALTVQEMQKTQIKIIATHTDSSYLTYQGFWDGQELPIPGEIGLGEILNFDPPTGTLSIFPQFGHAGAESQFLLVVSDGHFSSTADLKVTVEKPEEYTYAPTLNLRLNAQTYAKGDFLELRGNISNSEAPCKVDFHVIVRSENELYQESFVVRRKISIPHAFEISDIRLLNVQIGSNISAQSFSLTGVFVHSGQNVSNTSNWLASDVVNFQITE